MKLLPLFSSVFFMLFSYSATVLAAGKWDVATSRAHTTWYVDSRAGNDKNSGTRPEAAFRTLSRIQEVRLYPGDTVRFKRGSVFQGPFYIYASGNKTRYIVISDYGGKDQHAPKFTNPVFKKGNYGNCIRIKGSYVLVENLYCHFTAAYVRGDYDHGFLTVWEMGAIYIDKGAIHCIVRNNEIEDCVVGIKSYGKHALIEGNYIHDCNRVLKEWAWGPIGIWFGEDYQEARHNRIFNYRAEDPRIRWDNGTGGGTDGGAFEIDDARVNKSHIAIHHNYTRDCQGFLEVTWTDVKQHPVYRDFNIHHNISDDYQQFVALWVGAHCRIENNTIIRRKVNSNDWGVFNITQDNARNHIVNNIIITEKGIQVFNTGLGIDHKPASIIKNNLYFGASGKLKMGKEGPGEAPVFGDPLLVNYKYGNSPEHFSITANSPALNKGIPAGYKFDFINTPIPQEERPDIGAFEFKSAGIPLAVAE